MGRIHPRKMARIYIAILNQTRGKRSATPQIIRGSAGCNSHRSNRIAQLIPCPKGHATRTPIYEGEFILELKNDY